MPLYVPKSVNVALSEGQLKDIFKQHDTDGDGRLSHGELKNAFQQLGAHIPLWRVRRSLHHADKDGDGFVSLDELDSLVKYAVKFGYSIN